MPKKRNKSKSEGKRRSTRGENKGGVKGSLDGECGLDNRAGRDLQACLHMPFKSQ